MAHKHAALMLLYAQDAAETDRPWERWQARCEQGWFALDDNPDWCGWWEYRRKPSGKDADIKDLQQRVAAIEFNQRLTTYIQISAWAAAAGALDAHEKQGRNESIEKLLAAVKKLIDAYEAMTPAEDK